MNVLLKLFSYSFIIIIFYSCSSTSIIDGYTDKQSYKVGDTFSLYLNAKRKIGNYLITINDINGHVIDTVYCDIYPQKTSNSLPYENGFGYQATLVSQIPNLKSGIYLFDNLIPFVVRPVEKVDILILYNSNTENAYCDSGGESLYSYDENKKRHKSKVSFLRPIGLPQFSDEFFRWIDTQNDYNIGYLCDKDMDEYENLKNIKLLIIPGHSEYWTRKARRNFDCFIEEGNNALILSGNTMWWQTRYNTEKNQLICYRNKDLDMFSDSLKTLTWADTLLKYPIMKSIGVDFNHGGYGLKKDNGWDGYRIKYSNSPLLSNTGLIENQVLHLPSKEYDGAKLNFSIDSSVVTLTNEFSFYKYELIGYDLGSRQAVSNAAWVVLQRSVNSGVIINTGSTNWCAKEGMLGEDSKLIKTITLNMIDLLIQPDKKKVFATI